MGIADDGHDRYAAALTTRPALLATTAGVLEPCFELTDAFARPAAAYLELGLARAPGAGAAPPPRAAPCPPAGRARARTAGRARRVAAPPRRPPRAPPCVQAPTAHACSSRARLHHACAARAPRSLDHLWRRR